MAARDGEVSKGACTEILAVDVLEELRIHEFEDDEEAHDDEATEKLYAEFSAEFDRVEAALTKQYGKPSRIGKKDDKTIPLNEDRGVPIQLMLGTTESRGRTHG